MIKQLKIQNFQSHKLSRLVFSKGVNTIVGASDSGKSAILRALKWVIFNRPLGNAFKSNWGGATIVKLKTNDDLIIRKDSKEKYYKLNNGKPSSPGTDVPEEIKEALNMQEINLQQQLDSPFLISQSSGAVAQYFNKIANLSKIDTAQGNIKKWLKDITKTIEFKKGELEKAVDELDKYENVDKIEIQIEVLEKSNEKVNRLQSKQKNLSKVIQYIEGVELDIARREALIDSFEEPISIITEKMKKRVQIKNELTNLKYLISSINNNQEKIEKFVIFIASEQLILKLTKLYNEKEKIQSNARKLNDLFIKIKNCNIAIENAETNYKSISNKFEREMGDTCILCGSKLK